MITALQLFCMLLYVAGLGLTGTLFVEVLQELAPTLPREKYPITVLLVTLYVVLWPATMILLYEELRNG